MRLAILRGSFLPDLEIKGELTMKAIGWTLIAAAVLMHFCFCEWDEWDAYGRNSESQIVGFIYAKETARREIAGREGYNTAGAGFWGLVLPTLMAGGGIALIKYGGDKEKRHRRSSTGTQKARESRQQTAGFGRCAHCGGWIATTATSCHHCGKPVPSPKVVEADKTLGEWFDLLEEHTESEVVSEPANPKLVPCPDCGRQVSGLAESCPQCGRPLRSKGPPPQAN